MADVKDIVYQGWLVKAPPDAKSALKVGSSLSSHSDNRCASPPLFVLPPASHSAAHPRNGENDGFNCSK